MITLANRYRVELDRALSKPADAAEYPIQRIVPRYPQLGGFLSRTRFKIGATVYFDGKAYAAELHHTRGDEIHVQLWRNGRALPEKHMLDVRQAVIATYCETFALKPVIVLGIGTRYRRDFDRKASGVTL